MFYFFFLPVNFQKSLMPWGIHWNELITIIKIPAFWKSWSCWNASQQIFGSHLVLKDTDSGTIIKNNLSSENCPRSFFILNKEGNERKGSSEKSLRHLDLKAGNHSMKRNSSLRCHDKDGEIQEEVTFLEISILNVWRILLRKTLRWPYVVLLNTTCDN